MPWKVSDPVSERLDFVRRWLDGERVVDLCHEFGISRKTAYKMRARFEELGPRGLFDLTRARKTQELRTPLEVEKVVLSVREKHPTWGPKKIYAWLLAREPGFKLPCPATMGNILTRNHVVRRRMRRKTFMPYGAPLREAVRPNDGIIRTDNGTPFAGPGLWALTRLSVRWLRLGIWPERIAPSHPEQNGQHERMHLVLKQETTRPAGANFLQQQERFDRFVHVYNSERPHEALGQRPPASVYAQSLRQMPKKLPDPEYPLHDATLRVHPSGDLWLTKRDYFRVSSVLARELVGVREIDDGRWLITFMQLDLGHYDCRTRRFEPIQKEPTTSLA